MNSHVSLWDNVWHWGILFGKIHLQKFYLSKNILEKTFKRIGSIKQNNGINEIIFFINYICFLFPLWSGCVYYYENRLGFKENDIWNFKVIS